MMHGPMNIKSDLRSYSYTCHQQDNLSLSMIFGRKLFCVFQAAQAMCEGDQTQLISELERQLATANEELCKKEEKIQVKYGWKSYLYKHFIYHNLILCSLRCMSDFFVKMI